MAIKTRAVSFVWGFAEATFFFFVPDIWLTRIAVTDLKEAVVNAFIALLGALFGGSVLYVSAGLFFDETRQFLDAIPAISEELIDRAGTQMQETSPLKSIMAAGFTGLPFKIYAAWSGYLAISFPVFLLVSAAARLSRFLSLVFIAYGIKNMLKRTVRGNGLLYLHAGLWALFYGYYFFKMGL